MKTVVAGAVGECVHVAGVNNFLRLADLAGWRTVFLGPAIPVEKVLDTVGVRDGGELGLVERLFPQEVRPGVAGNRRGPNQGGGDIVVNAQPEVRDGPHQVVEPRTPDMNVRDRPRVGTDEIIRKNERRILQVDIHSVGRKIRHLDKFRGVRVGPVCPRRFERENHKPQNSHQERQAPVERPPEGTRPSEPDRWAGRQAGNRHAAGPISGLFRCGKRADCSAAIPIRGCANQDVEEDFEAVLLSDDWISSLHVCLPF